MSDADTLPDTVEVVAGAESAGSRADRFLADAIGDLSRSRVKSLIEAGAVRRAGTRLCNPAETVRPGDRFTLQRPIPVPAAPLPQVIAFTILYEDADLIVLDKPAGLVVHPAPGNQDGTLVNALLAHCGDTLPGIGGEKRPGIVHRLDKATSGVMVAAKTEMALARLSAAFASRNLDRRYTAVVWGLPSPGSGAVEAAVGRDVRDRKRMAVVAAGGKPALTRYVTRQAWPPVASLLHCTLGTGRTHQIRVHLASIGHPLVGDPVYLRRVPVVAKLAAPAMRQALLDFPRQALHASSLAFDHPRTGARLDFTTELPDDMQGLLDSLGTPHSA